MKHTRVLNFVNKTRKALGYKPLKKLPKGLPLEPDQCPLAVAFHSDYVEERYITIPSKKKDKIKQIFKTKFIYEDHDGTGDIVDIKTPKLLQDFINKFDTYKYPELILKEYL